VATDSSPWDGETDAADYPGRSCVKTSKNQHPSTRETPSLKPQAPTLSAFGAEKLQGPTSKHQPPTSKFQKSSKDQASKKACRTPCSVWSLRIEACLVLGV